VKRPRLTAYGGLGAALALVLGASAPAGRAQVAPASADCQPEWISAFGEQPGVEGTIHALVVFDDGRGAGPVLCVAGEFTAAGGTTAQNIASWNGSTWSALGTGVDDVVNVLAVFDDGGGPALYAGGRFMEAGGVPASCVARWDGSSWSPLGLGLASLPGGSLPEAEVNALAVYDGDDGPSLYVGGYFWEAGHSAAQHIARWNGTGWSAVGTGTNQQVEALAVYDDGSGPLLVAGGSFTLAGGVAVERVAAWDGASWSALGGGMSGRVSVLTVVAEGLGGGAPAGLYAGGTFDSADGNLVNSVARWDGSIWTGLGTGLSGAVQALAVFDDGSVGGPVVYAGGPFTSTADGLPVSHVARWDGASWSGLAGGTAGDVLALAVFDDGQGDGATLCVGGDFTTADGLCMSSIGAWTGSEWRSLGTGLSGEVRALVAFDDGDGPALIVGGEFLGLGGAPPLNHIARWDGATWSSLGGMDGPVNALAVYDDGQGAGPVLYAGGEFLTAGGVAAKRIARWDGSTWSKLGAGLSDAHPLNDEPPGARCLLVHDDGNGNGPRLFVGGAFVSAGNKFANNIASWNGTSWFALAGGTYIQEVIALATFDDGLGGGPALFAGGDFEKMGSLTVHKIAKWNGVNWSKVGTGLSGRVNTLAVFDDGGGPKLHAAGIVYSSPGNLNVVRWDGSTWSPIGIEIDQIIWDLTVFDDGTGGGPALYAGGNFTLADGVAANRVAKWDGAGWSPLGGGMNGDVRVLVEFDDGSGPALVAGGDFGAFDTQESFLATWGGCADSPGFWTSLGSGIAGSDGVAALQGSGAQLAGQPVVLALDHAPPSSLAMLFVGLSNAPTPFKGGMLVPVPALVSLALATGPSGSIALPFAWPAGLPSAFNLYYQFALPDAGAVQGVALSNALKSTTP